MVWVWFVEVWGSGRGVVVLRNIPFILLFFPLHTTALWPLHALGSRFIDYDYALQFECDEFTQATVLIARSPGANWVEQFESRSIWSGWDLKGSVPFTTIGLSDNRTSQTDRLPSSASKARAVLAVKSIPESESIYIYIFKGQLVHCWTLLWIPLSSVLILE